jgi:hypothetical protein
MQLRSQERHKVSAATKKSYDCALRQAGEIAQKEAERTYGRFRIAVFRDSFMTETA